jgi:hypothetical protein
MRIAAPGNKTPGASLSTLGRMCRSIQQLRGAEPPATRTEVREAALQYVRKISGYRVPSGTNAEAFDTAVAEIAAITQRLLDDLVVAPGSKPAVPVQRRLRERATSA